MNELHQKLSEPFKPEAERTFTKTWTARNGREHSMTFTYIEDERVMDRLDELEVRWQLKVRPIDVDKGIVLVSLGIYDGDWLWFEDFGYPTRLDGEPMKEAVSDGIRRVGRMVGVGRYLYVKQEEDDPAPPRGARPPAVAERKSDPGAGKPSPAALRKLMASFDEKGLKDPDFRKVFTMTATGKGSSKDLTNADLDKLFVALAAYVPAQ